MRREIARTVLWVGLIILLCSELSGQERWIYRYDGPGNDYDCASSIAMGSDGNLYVAGSSTGRGTGTDLTVISLTAKGGVRWVYRYNGPGSGSDGAVEIVMGTDGNLYVAGASVGNGTDSDLVVISLSPSAEERWVYRYNGPVNGSDGARSIVMGTDGNLYAAGSSAASATLEDHDLTVVSLTPTGEERWVYRYGGPANWFDGASSIIMGTDGNLYAAGQSFGSGTDADFVVISLDRSGAEHWIYRYDGPGNLVDGASSIVMGPSGNLYAIGHSWGAGTREDFIVVSLSPLGAERWVYRYNGLGNGNDWGSVILIADDGEIYAAGYSEQNGSFEDLTVLSLTRSGQERWMYHYDGPGNHRDRGRAIAAGIEGNLYAAGVSEGSGTGEDFTLIGLSPEGDERWVYRYDGPGNDYDEPHSLVAATDGSLYAAGKTTGSGSHRDFTVISLIPDLRSGGQLINDQLPTTDVGLFQVHPNPFSHSTTIQFSIFPSDSEDPSGPRGNFQFSSVGGFASGEPISVRVYDLSGRLVRTLVDNEQMTNDQIPMNVVWDGTDETGRRVGSGVYFCRLVTREYTGAKKLVLVR